VHTNDVFEPGIKGRTRLTGQEVLPPMRGQIKTAIRSTAENGNKNIKDNISNSALTQEGKRSAHVLRDAQLG
jgi:hypothetical protein